MIRFLKDRMSSISSDLYEEILKPNTRFFYKQRFFSTQPQCCLTFSWIELQMSLSCCLIHTGIIILRHFLYLIYLSPYLGQGLFMSYLCDLFLIFIFFFIMINSVISWKNTRLLFCLFFRIRPIIYWMITWMKNLNSYQVTKVQPQGVAHHLLDFLPILD